MHGSAKSRFACSAAERELILEEIRSQHLSDKPKSQASLGRDNQKAHASTEVIAAFANFHCHYELDWQHAHQE